MAAYATLVSLSQTVDIFLNYHQDAISPQVKDQIISIKDSAIFLQDFLQHFQDKANRVEEIIRAVTHAVENIVELCMSKLISRESNFEHVLKELIPYYLKEAADEMEWIARRMKKMKSRIIVKDERTGDSSGVNSSSSRVASSHKDDMVGFENARLEIKSRLRGESSKLEVIPIVGMGGIGKTTLARNVHDDPLIMEHFDIREWVTVSQKYRIKDIISNLLVSMKVFAAEDESMKAHHVSQNLKSRRYLIVLDDLWSTDAWDDLMMMFPDDGNGSRIMITTRLSDMATYPDPYSAVHEMCLMDMDLSWELLRQKIFKKEECPVELEYVGKLIARNCRGLPLAIVVISGILSIDHTASAWHNIALNVTSHISADSEQFDKILSLSYAHLPRHLRPCFLYMGIFEEDYEVRASRLAKLWAAEVFLKPKGCNKSFEETAEENIEDLVKRSLIFVTSRKFDGRIKRLSMHDLTRDMCIRISQEEKYGHTLRRNFGIVLRTISSHPVFPENFYGLTIRAIISRFQELSFVSLQDFRLLRILDLLDTNNQLLPAQVSQLFHLRYLGFNGLFSSLIGMSNLQNLQTLIINSSSYGKILRYNGSDYFPFLLEIWSMPQLRHLVLQSGFCFSLPPVHHQEGAKLCLENLQTLSVAINFICTLKILETIPNLKKLKISYSACRDDEHDYLLHNLIHMQRLENLTLDIHKEFPFPEKVRPTFPITLKKLTLSGVGLPWEDMKIVGSLPNLKVLKLREFCCKGDTWVTAEEEFSELHFLLIDGSDLQDWIIESSHFPKLVRLVLRRCQRLIEIPNEIGDVATLEVIEVDDDDLLKSAKQIQVDQQSYGNEDLQVIRLV